jgi:hypothetical protein
MEREEEKKRRKAEKMKQKKMEKRTRRNKLDVVEVDDSSEEDEDMDGGKNEGLDTHEQLEINKITLASLLAECRKYFLATKAEQVFAHLNPFFDNKVVIVRDEVDDENEQGGETQHLTTLSLQPVPHLISFLTDLEETVELLRKMESNSIGGDKTKSLSHYHYTWD